jgi:hypothetical protein
VLVGSEALPPPAIPARLPEIEPQGEEGDNPARDVLSAPPVERAGVQLWLKLTPGRQVMAMDRESCERLRALGYIGGDCAGVPAR